MELFIRKPTNGHGNALPLPEYTTLKGIRGWLVGKLRFEPKYKEPGFLKLQLNQVEKKPAPEKTGVADGSFGSTITLVTKQGTTIHVSREVSLKQVARLTRMLDASWPHDLG